tara:strand:+ start:7441 stop:8358 length:918 start_codon:yes stop_codon:yes gene_type:complete
MFFFSIIIPTFNDLNNLKRCLRGVYKQTFHDYEIIIINDGSSDETKFFLNSLNKKNITIINLEKNKGPAFSRNLGINSCKGFWVAFLDSDDFWLKDKLQITFNNIQLNDNFEVFCHNQYRKEKSTRKIKKLYTGPYKDKFYNNLILEGNCLITSATIIKKDFLIKNNIFFRTEKRYYSVEDYDLWLNLAMINARFFFIKNFLGFYCIHNNNITNNILKHKKNYLFLLYNHVFKKQNFEKNKFRLWKIIYCKYLIELIVINIFYINNLIKGLSLFFRSIKKYRLLFIISLFNYLKLKINTSLRKFK